MLRALRSLAYPRYNLLLLSALLTVSILTHYLIYRHIQASNSVHVNRDLKPQNMKLTVDKAQRTYSRRCTLLKTNFVLCEEAPERLPTLYIVTPTYRRPEQIAELTRLSHTLMLVPRVHWIVVEDGTKLNPLVTDLLISSGILFEYLLATMPVIYKYYERPPKGVANRNKALKWIRKHAHEDGIVYFADDDNTYDIQLFEEVRRTRRVSAFPVGLVERYGVSAPMAVGGRFVGFFDSFGPRRFMVDMAGFAMAVRFLRARPAARMPYRNAYEEEGFLRSLRPLRPDQLELLADNCTKILVWHTQTKKMLFDMPKDRRYIGTNIEELFRILEF